MIHFKALSFLRKLNYKYFKNKSEKVGLKDTIYGDIQRQAKNNTKTHVDKKQISIKIPIEIPASARLKTGSKKVKTLSYPSKTESKVLSEKGIGTANHCGRSI